MSDRPAVAIYAALSKASDDPDQTSIESQTAAVRARLGQLYRDGYELLGEFNDDGYSGSKRNRGPGLEQAIRTAVVAAHDRGGVVELWANTSARFGRGTGRRDEARAIGALFYDLRAQGVQLRSVADDEFVSNEMLVGIGSATAAKYSADLSESIKRAKVRQLARGDHLGGPVCDGYRILALHDDTGQVVGRKFALDPAREPVVRSIFDAAADGVPDGMIARRLNAEGVRTRHGRPFTRRAIQNTVTNPWYAGRVAYKRGTPDEQVVDGNHPPMVEPSVFDRIQRSRATRDHAEPEQKAIGRPARNHALARLAVCGRCGERLYAVTSNYRRKDGSRARSYACHAYRFSTGTCDAKPIDAEVVDAAVIAGLDSLLVDFDAWRQRLDASATAERDRLSAEIERAQHDLDDQAERAAKVGAKWADLVATDDDAAELVLPIVERERLAHVASERRLRAAQDALASVPAEANADAMLDFANALRVAITGRLDDSGTMAEVNQALRELFESFSVHETRYAGPVENDDGTTGFTFGHATRRAVLVAPVVKLSVVHALSDEWPKLIAADAEPPPLRWLEQTADPERNVSNSQL